MREIAEAEAKTMTALADAVRAKGIEVAEISVGATPTVRYSVDQKGLTELRPGNYIYFDRTQVSLGAAGWDDCALTVLARVVTKPAPDRIIVDSGSKTLTNDLARGFAPAPGYGAVLRSTGGVQSPDETSRRRAAVGRARQRPRDERHARARARRSRPHRPEPLVRRVQPGGLGLARGR